MSVLGSVLRSGSRLHSLGRHWSRLDGGNPVDKRDQQSALARELFDLLAGGELRRVVRAEDEVR
jgi:hypothetical protein